MEFWTYYRMLRKRYRTVAAIVVAAMLVNVALAIAQPGGQEFVATVTLTTAPQDENRLLLVLVTDQRHVPDINKSVAVELIQSRTVAERVIQRLNLDRTPVDLRSRLRVTSGEGDLITLTVRDKDRATAILLANTFAEVAVTYNQEVNRREAALAREYIEREREDTRQRLRQAEVALDTFKRKNGIVALSAQINGEVARFIDLISQQRAAALSEREITARIGALRGQLKKLSGTKADQALAENPIAQRLRADLVALEVQLATAQSTYTVEHPAIITLNKRIKVLKDALEREINRVVTTEFVSINPIHEKLLTSLVDLETQRLALQAKQAALATIVPEEQKRLPALSDIEREYNRLNRDVQTLESSLANLESRLNDFRVREQVATNRNLIYIVDPAGTAEPMTRSRLWVQTLLIGMLGLAGGVGLVLFQHSIDNSLKTAQDAEHLLNLPVLSSIPRHNPPFDEAYNLLKTNLGLHVYNGGAKAIMFTSAKPGSGTSTVVYNLAKAIARAGKRVIVVDADLRRSAAIRLFKVLGEHGLREVLLGTVALQDALQASSVENVKVLPAIPADSSVGEFADLFGSAEMEKLLRELKQQADTVLIDTPPIIAFAESRALAPIADGVVFVVSAGQVTRGVEEEAKRQLERTQAQVLGIVVTKVTPENDDGYYFHEKYTHPTTH